ncbi:MAG: thiamine phosphate synthase [Gemmatimonadales bacterium]
MTIDLVSSLRLVAVTDDAVLAGRDLVEACAAAASGGATMIQLRLKHASARELVELCRSLLARVTVPVLVNDRIDVALAARAHGVHLGTDDVEPARARTIAPPGFIIGASVGVEAEVPRGREADYWGIGPWRVTRTKGDAGNALGVEGFAEIARQAGGKPCVAIGGVEPEDVAPVIAAGGAGIAVVSGIFAAADVESAARRYRTALQRVGR